MPRFLINTNPSDLNRVGKKILDDLALTKGQVERLRERIQHLARDGLDTGFRFRERNRDIEQSLIGWRQTSSW
jgi:hypothetical protein